MTRHNKPEIVSKVKIKKSQLFQLLHDHYANPHPFERKLLKINLNSGDGSLYWENATPKRFSEVRHTYEIEQDERRSLELPEGELSDTESFNVSYISTGSISASKGEIYSTNGRTLRKLWENRIETLEVAEPVEIEWIDDVTVLGFLREKMS